MHLSAVIVFALLWLSLALGAALTWRLINRLRGSEGPFEEGL